MEQVNKIADREFEFMSQPVQPDGRRLVVRISKVGGGTLGKAYDGRWMYRVKRVGDRRILAEGDDLRTGTPKTHQQVVGIVLDFLDDLGGDERADRP